MKIPRHLRPKALSRALRKEKVDRVLERPRLKMSCYLHEMPAKQPEPAPGTREARRWELRARIQARRLAALRAARSGMPGSEKPDGSATGVAHESGTAAPALTPTPSQRIGRDGPAERAADYVAGQSESSRKQLLKQWAVGIAWTGVVVLAAIWIVTMNLLVLAAIWISTPILAGLLCRRSVAACFTLKGIQKISYGILLIVGISTFGMLIRQLEFTDYFGATFGDGYTSDKVAPKHPRFGEIDENELGPDSDGWFIRRNGYWIDVNAALTLGMGIFQLGFHLAAFIIVPCGTWVATKRAMFKREREISLQPEEAGTGRFLPGSPTGR
jgi:hypothetical protein